MKKQWVLPAPAYAHYVCYPEFLGHYNHFPQHAERRSEGVLNSYNLHLVFEGTGYVFQEGERIPMGRGSGFLFPRGAYQQYGSDPRRPGKCAGFTSIQPFPCRYWRKQISRGVISLHSIQMPGWSLFLMSCSSLAQSMKPGVNLVSRLYFMKFWLHCCKIPSRFMDRCPWRSDIPLGVQPT